MRVRRGRAFALLALLAGLVGVSAHLAVAWWDEPLETAQAVIVEVEPGARLAGVANQLEAAKVLTHPTLWGWQMRLRGLAGRLRAGEYEVPPHVSPRELAALLVSGKVLLHPVTLVEGWTLREVLQTLHAQPFLKRTIDRPSEATALTVTGTQGLALEGQLFPDTYRVPKGTSDVELLKWAHLRLNQELQAAWTQRAPGLPFAHAGEALTLASIIEKETGNPEERPRIAGVFVNRLRKGMLLQTDPTVIYGMGERYQGVLHKADLLADTPWNTYTRKGLPPTPIALPGRASIEAALHPAQTVDLYFVASGKGDGRHTFSATLSAHNAAVAAYVASQRKGPAR